LDCGGSEGGTRRSGFMGRIPRERERWKYKWIDREDKMHVERELKRDLVI
jgi:hypothetical protein